MEDLANKTLGQFQIRHEVGRGGMAVVYEAYQPALQRKVALKILPPSLSHNAAFVKRFQQEAIAAAGLRHPNIVTIYDVGSQGPYSFIVMEFLEGQPLSDLIRRGPLPVARAARILEQVAQALDYAHKRGFIHRDIKPGNIMVGQANHATLTDFGIAKAATGTHLTQTGTIIGTPEYMSPEQIRGGEVDHRADIYALGIVAYEMLAGHLPFSGDTATVLYKQVHEMPPPLTALTQTPPHVIAAITRALAKDPAQRFQSASEFAAALADARAQPAVATPPTPPPIPVTAIPPHPYATPPQPIYAMPPTVQRRGGLPGWLPWLLGGAGIALLLCALAAMLVVATQRLATPTPQTGRVISPTPIVLIISATPPQASPTLRPTNTPVVKPVTPTLTRAEIEAGVKDALERFQKAKEYSQKTGDTSQLSNVLAGQALNRQIELVNQTKAQNCYWDIWLDAPTRYEFLEVRGDSYVRVKAYKTETRHKYCNNQLVASSSVDKESYSTSYTVERINGKWYVTVRE